MVTKKRADIVFLIDASDSMKPVLNAVKDNITKLVDTLANDTQRKWDICLDFLTHASGNGRMRYRSVRFDSSIAILNSLYHYDTEPAQYFFTTDIAKFKGRLAEIETIGDETTLIALNAALKYPWRPAQEGHRAIVLLTDEPIETGEHMEEQVAQICCDNERQYRDIEMERFGPCRARYCSCSGFKYSNDAQWCDNCGHSRSLHIHRHSSKARNAGPWQ
jgi:hypothetical protein